MGDDREIYAEAEKLILRHRKSAILAAAQKVEELQKSGDFEGQLFWSRIARVIIEWQRTEPEAGEPTH